MKAYETIVGLEIHVELLTKTKMFCGCKNSFGDAPNTNVCEVCLGFPGALPRINKTAIDYGIRAGLALDCSIRESFGTDRKKYFYPDLVKGYQITQDAEPLCYDGYIEVPVDDEAHKVRIERVHIEEDTGKAIHNEAGDTLMDYNRSGVPLIEIVTKPDIRSAEEARLFLTMLKSRLEYLGVSDVKMEEGSLRCDVNINVKNTETGQRTAITEVKNLNSFRAVSRAIESETQRHIALLEAEETGEKETRRWDDLSGRTLLMRAKGTSSDYRYSAEGDIPRIQLPAQMVEEIKRTLPEMPHVKKARFQNEYGLNEYDAENLTGDPAFARLFEELMQHTKDADTAANWMLGDFSRQVNDKEIRYDAIPFAMKDLADLLALVENQTIHLNAAKKVLRNMFETGGKPADIVEKEGLSQITDTGALEKIVDEVLDANPQSIEDIKGGKDRALGFLVGQCMKASKGKGNPQTMRQFLEEKIAQR